MPPSSPLPSDSDSNNPAGTELPPAVTPESNTKQVVPVQKIQRSKKPLLIAVGTVLLLGLASGTTFLVLSHVTKQTPQESKTPQQQAAQLAKQANDAATASANNGDTDGAIKHYNEALVQYQKAGDKAGEEAVKLQLKYYEMVKANEEEKSTTTTTVNETP